MSSLGKVCLEIRAAQGKTTYRGGRVEIVHDEQTAEILAGDCLMLGSIPIRGKVVESVTYNTRFHHGSWQARDLYHRHEEVFGPAGLTTLEEDVLKRTKFANKAQYTHVPTFQKRKKKGR